MTGRCLTHHLQKIIFPLDYGQGMAIAAAMPQRLLADVAGLLHGPIRFGSVPGSV
jgi:hypothetical protein